MQKQDFGQLNIMPGHTFLRKGYDSTRKKSNNSSQPVKTASEGMLQGAVKDVSVHPLCVNELATGGERSGSQPRKLVASLHMPCEH